MDVKPNEHAVAMYLRKGTVVAFLRAGQQIPLKANVVPFPSVTTDFFRGNFGGRREEQLPELTEDDLKGFFPSDSEEKTYPEKTNPKGKSSTELAKKTSSQKKTQHPSQKKTQPPPQKSTPPSSQKSTAAAEETILILGCDEENFKPKDLQKSKDPKYIFFSKNIVTKDDTVENEEGAESENEEDEAEAGENDISIFQYAKKTRSRIYKRKEKTKKVKDLLLDLVESDSIDKIIFVDLQRFINKPGKQKNTKRGEIDNILKPNVADITFTFRAVARVLKPGGSVFFKNDEGSRGKPREGFLNPLNDFFLDAASMRKKDPLMPDKYLLIEETDPAQIKEYLKETPVAKSLCKDNLAKFRLLTKPEQ